MKKKLILVLIIFLSLLQVPAYEYQEEYAKSVSTYEKPEKKQEVREIKNLTEYFKYLPAEVNRHWVPYKSEMSYEIEVMFKVNRDGSISKPEIVRSTNARANNSAIQAVTMGAPYQPLPKTYTRQYVTAHVILEYRK